MFSILNDLTIAKIRLSHLPITTNISIGKEFDVRRENESCWHRRLSNCGRSANFPDPDDLAIALIRRKPVASGIFCTNPVRNRTGARSGGSHVGSKPQLPVRLAENPIVSPSKIGKIPNFSGSWSRTKINSEQANCIPRHNLKFPKLGFQNRPATLDNPSSPGSMGLESPASPAHASTARTNRSVSGQNASAGHLFDVRNGLHCRHEARIKILSRKRRFPVNPAIHPARVFGCSEPRPPVNERPSRVQSRELLHYRRDPQGQAGHYDDLSRTVIFALQHFPGRACRCQSSDCRQRPSNFS